MDGDELCKGNRCALRGLGKDTAWVGALGTRNLENLTERIPLALHVCLATLSDTLGFLRSLNELIQLVSETEQAGDSA